VCFFHIYPTRFLLTSSKIFTVPAYARTMAPVLVVIYIINHVRDKIWLRLQMRSPPSIHLSRALRTHHHHQHVTSWRISPPRRHGIYAIFSSDSYGHTRTERGFHAPMARHREPVTSMPTSTSYILALRFTRDWCILFANMIDRVQNHIHVLRILLVIYVSYNLTDMLLF
jgi:hypothetical protein